MANVYRVFTEKKKEHASLAKSVLNDIKHNLEIDQLKDVRIFNRYDVQGIENYIFEKAKTLIFSEPQVDDIYDTLPNIADDHKILAVEFLPGQFDQRADSCAQCIQILTQDTRPLIRSATVYIFIGNINDNDMNKIEKYLINPVEAQKASFDLPENLKDNFNIPTEVETLEGFINLDENGLKKFINKYSLAMDFDDILMCQNYFKNDECRDPSITEIKMIDTYWSDHCRHTTFLTSIDEVDICDECIKKAYDEYLEIRNEIYKGKTKDITLMDIAVIGAKYLKSKGLLKELDESEEINACSIKIKVDVNGKDEDWLLMFKNETHNHPTEIEPFGGAATCLGGAIRDPLSGRSYVYQAMRVTGAADPTLPLSQTMKGKLSQKKIVTTAAAGYSSYGNQIGLATGIVDEIYHKGYVAKRLEIGAVVGAAPAENVRRERPAPSDVIVLLGGKTGRDGCGGATGSSKSHTTESITTCGSEVQKGNPPEERKIQRLFRNPKATKLIKRCNDFGAGGVSVAIGEIADGLMINLNAVPKKYEGLDGTEIAISESQERMAVCIDKNDLEEFISYANEENLEATLVATVTDENRLKMKWNDKIIVDLSREFLNSNGATKHTTITVEKVENQEFFYDYKFNKESLKEDIIKFAGDLNICSKKGLIERFDSSIGASTVFMPLSGKYQKTPVQVMAAKIPVLNGTTDTASVMAYGFNPNLSEKSPYHGAVSAVVESATKLVASGCDYKNIYLTFQEYFERTKNDPKRWGKPFAALLGALKAQIGLSAAAIGGKDSMSGTFEDIDVPPTLVSFAISPAKASKIISNELKSTNSKLYYIQPKYNKDNIVDFEDLTAKFEYVTSKIANGDIITAWSLARGGIIEAVIKMGMGNKNGVALENLDVLDLTRECYGAFVVEAKSDAVIDGKLIGKTNTTDIISVLDTKISYDDILQSYDATLENVFPTKADTLYDNAKNYNYSATDRYTTNIKIATPRVFIPVFPGTNCEYDTARAFEKYGAKCETFIVNNLTSSNINASVKKAAKLIGESQIVMIPGGFSGGDEPDGSGKFIATFFRNSAVKEAVTDLLDNRDGLMMGICNGFQALIKLGLVPFGKIVDMDDTCPTLTFNTISRHQSMMVNTKISSNKSPWLANVNVGDIHSVPISHGEGRFVCSDELLKTLAENGQIATQYVDLSGKPTMDIAYNPNSSIDAIEGIISPDGRVFGKMAHSERFGDNICKNVPGNKDQLIFKSGVEYFK